MHDNPLTLDPEYTRPELSCRFWDPFLDLLQERYGAGVVEEICSEAGLPASFLRDPQNWISASFARRLGDVLCRRLFPGLGPWGTDHPAWQLYREAGWRAMDRVYLGPLYHAARMFGSPKNIFRLMPEMIRRGNTILRGELVEISDVRAVVRYYPVSEQNQDHIGFCWNRIGALEGVTALWGLPRAHVRHPACCHSADHPSPYCEYEVLFRSPTLSGVRHPLFLGVLGGALGAAAASLGGGAPGLVALSVLAGAGAAGAASLARAVRALERERRQEHASMNELVATADERYQALWNEQLALRRALLANRKIAGYLAADVVDRILQNPEAELQLGGVLTEAAVLFADIVGFTARCERKTPEVVVEELNLFFGHMDREIDRAQGIVDKRLGDGLMVVFVSRSQHDTHADVRRRAVSCALGMIRALEPCASELAARGAEPIRVRIGIASGSLVQGNIGSPVKLEYTVIGDVVNLASRLEGLARPDHLAVDASVWEAAADIMGAVEEDEVQVKGKRHPVRVYRTV